MSPSASAAGRPAVRAVVQVGRLEQRLLHLERGDERPDVGAALAQRRGQELQAADALGDALGEVAQLVEVGERLAQRGDHLGGAAGDLVVLEVGVADRREPLGEERAAAVVEREEGIELGFGLADVLAHEIVGEVARPEARLHPLAELVDVAGLLADLLAGRRRRVGEEAAVLDAGVAQHEDVAERLARRPLIEPAAGEGLAHVVVEALLHRVVVTGGAPEHDVAFGHAVEQRRRPTAAGLGRRPVGAADPAEHEVAELVHLLVAVVLAEQHGVEVEVVGVVVEEHGDLAAAEALRARALLLLLGLAQHVPDRLAPARAGTGEVEEVGVGQELPRRLLERDEELRGQRADHGDGQRDEGAGRRHHGELGGRAGGVEVLERIDVQHAAGPVGEGGERGEDLCRVAELVEGALELEVEVVELAQPRPEQRQRAGPAGDVEEGQALLEHRPVGLADLAGHQVVAQVALDVLAQLEDRLERHSRLGRGVAERRERCAEGLDGAGGGGDVLEVVLLVRPDLEAIGALEVVLEAVGEDLDDVDLAQGAEDDRIAGRRLAGAEREAGDEAGGLVAAGGVHLLEEVLAHGRVAGAEDDLHRPPRGRDQLADQERLAHLAGAEDPDRHRALGGHRQAARVDRMAAELLLQDGDLGARLAVRGEPLHRLDRCGGGLAALGAEQAVLLAEVGTGAHARPPAIGPIRTWSTPVSSQ